MGIAFDTVVVVGRMGDVLLEVDGEETELEFVLEVSVSLVCGDNKSVEARGLRWKNDHIYD